MVFHVFEATVPPPPRPDNKARRGYYTRSLLCEAVKQAMYGTMTVTEAARCFKIPRTTIQKHVSKAREQHLLKEHYIRQIEAARRHQAHTEKHESCPDVFRGYGNTTHWTQLPIRISGSPSTSRNKVQCLPGEDMIIAEQCEVKSEECVTMEAVGKSEESLQSSVKPMTRIVLKREGREDVVREDTMSAHKAVKALRRPELYPLYLYKRILRLHYGLPPPARLMGDTYVKDEFRRHKNATPEQTAVFINEWTNYCITLAKQLSQKGIVKGFLGKDLEPEKLDIFAEDQLRQLLDLKIESERMARGEIAQSVQDSSAERTKSG